MSGNLLNSNELLSDFPITIYDCDLSPTKKNPLDQQRAIKVETRREKKIDAQIGIKETDKCTVAIPTLAL